MITSGDFLAGGGGVTEAMRQIPQLNVRLVLNHDKIAIRTNMFNHKGITYDGISSICFTKLKLKYK